ncbi:conserved hypothetical protein [uncultured Paludibacter sp.]|nr:conserved hypothetical protein [uncultured Paludibacter sp.]
MRTTTLDPLAEKYYSISPYAWCGNNPVNAVDPNGMEFTDEAWKYVKKLMAEVQRQQDANNKKIGDKQAMLDKGGLSAKQVKSLEKQINNLKNSNSDLEQVRGETATLAASSQMYDMEVDNSLSVSDQLGNKTLTGKTEWQNGTVLMSIPNSYNLSFIAHELKHGYQFETGNFSFGSAGLPFYDKYDELEAYQRGAMFGGERYNDIYSLPPIYKGLQDGPSNAQNILNATSFLKYQSPFYQNEVTMFAHRVYALQRLSTQHNAIFRIEGHTYKP